MFRCVVVCLVLLCSTPAINKFDADAALKSASAWEETGEREREGRRLRLWSLTNVWRSRMRDLVAMEKQLISAHVKKCEGIAGKFFHTRSVVGIFRPLFPNFPKTRLCSPHYQLRSALKSFFMCVRWFDLSQQATSRHSNETSGNKSLELKGDVNDSVIAVNVHPIDESGSRTRRVEVESLNNTFCCRAWEVAAFDSSLKFAKNWKSKILSAK